jgi:hypothetical protein
MEGVGVFPAGDVKLEGLELWKNVAEKPYVILDEVQTATLPCHM